MCIAMVVVLHLGKAGCMLATIVVCGVAVLLLGHRVACLCMGKDSSCAVPSAKKHAIDCARPLAPWQRAPGAYLSSSCNVDQRLYECPPAADSLQPRPLTLARLPSSGST